MKTCASDALRQRTRSAHRLPARHLCCWLLLALITAGCSTLPLVYERGSTLALWWLDDYLDLDDAQRASARAALDDWFRWHRATELGIYAEALAALRRDAGHDLDAARICAAHDEIRARFRAGLAHALPAFATLARSLDARQRAHLAARYAESNAEWRREKRLDDTPAAQRAHLTDEATDRARSLYGRLSRTERAAIARRIGRSPYDANVRFAERAARQHDTLEALARIAALPATGHAAAAQHILVNLAAGYLDSPRAGYRRYHADLVAYNCALIADVHNDMDATQRAKAVRRLGDWEDDFRRLAAHAAP